MLLKFSIVIFSGNTLYGAAARGTAIAYTKSKGYE
jgi:hypothetical protein